MRPILIKVCHSNESAKYVAQLLEIASKYENVKLVTEECLNRCSFCEDTPYVLINNGVEFGDDMAELLANINETLASYRK